MSKSDETVIDAETATKLFDNQLEAMDQEIARYEKYLYKLRIARAEFAASRNQYAKARDNNGG
jgi:hypothetical protein